MKRLNIAAKGRLQYENYSWGTLRILEIGIKYKCIIHPENHTQILQVADGSLDSYTFTDEQKIKWDVTLNGDKLKFNGGRGKSIDIAVSDYK